MKKSTFIQVIKYVAPIFISVILICIVFVRVFPELRDIVINGCTYEELMDYLDSIANFKGILVVAVLQVIQVISIFIPGPPIQIAAGIVYGFLISFLVTFISFVITNMLVFLYLRKKGDITFSPDSRSGRKVQALFEWIDSENPAYMIMLAYMMPGMPNGFVPYVANQTSVTTKQFFKALVYGAAPQFFTMCFISGRLLRGDVFLSLLVTVLMLVSIVILYLFRDRVIDLVRRMKEQMKNKKMQIKKERGS